MPSEIRVRQILAEMLPRLIPADVGAVGNLGAGRVFYVNNAASNESDTPTGGTSWANPLATIDYAIGLCVANRGDVIMVGPGHADTVTDAGGIAADVAGISIVGVGNGFLRPTITFTTAAAASFNISAANVRVENLAFICGIDDQTAMMNITANYAIVRNCYFLLGDSSFDAEAGIVGSGLSDFSVIENNFFRSGSTTAITNGAISMGAASYAKIRNNEIYGYFGTAGAIVNTAACSGFDTIGNMIVNLSADANNQAIVYDASTTGIVANNRVAVIDSTSPNPFTCAAAYVSGNYFTGAAGTSPSTLK